MVYPTSTIIINVLTSWFYHCFEWYIQQKEEEYFNIACWFYHCFEWYIQQRDAFFKGRRGWFYHCFEWYIQLGIISSEAAVGFIIVLSGISYYGKYNKNKPKVGLIIVLNGISKYKAV